MGKRVLLVDDSAVIRTAAASALKDAGYDVTTRAGVEDLVEHGVDGYDLILMDVQMPELYGDDVAAVLRHERGVVTPIYLFSSGDPTEFADLTRNARVDGFISKRDGMDALIARVGAILR